MRVSTFPRNCGTCLSSYPVASPRGNNGEFGQGDGLVDSNCYFLGALNRQTEMAIVVPDGDKCLEPGPLACKVCFCMDIIFKTSSLRYMPRKKLMISDSLMGKEKREKTPGMWYSYLDQVARLGPASWSSVIWAGSLTAAPRKEVSFILIETKIRSIHYNWLTCFLSHFYFYLFFQFKCS